ncbi:hypothetical protein DRP44_05240, partial [candidate division TA06 bacterium]
VLTRIDFFEYENKIVAVINVEKGPNKVYYVNHIPYIRDNDESRPAEPEEVDKIYGIDETNYEEMDKRDVNQVAIHIFGYLKYPGPYELIQIINKYEKKYNKYKMLFINMFRKKFNVIDYPLSNEQLKYIVASYIHNRNSEYKQINVHKIDRFEYDKNDIFKILGKWNSYSRNNDNENLIYLLDNSPMPTKAIFTLRNGIFQYGNLELIEATITYKDFTYFIEVIKNIFKENKGA